MLHGIHYKPLQSVGWANPPACITILSLTRNIKLYKYTSWSGRRRGVGNTQFPCTRFREFNCDFVISTVISWFLPRFQITVISDFSSQPSEQHDFSSQLWFHDISDFNTNFWFQFRFLSDFRDFYRFLGLAGCMAGVRFRISALIPSRFLISGHRFQLISTDFTTQCTRFLLLPAPRS